MQTNPIGSLIVGPIGLLPMFNGRFSEEFSSGLTKMRRKVGVAAIKSRQEDKEKYSKVGVILETEKFSSVKETLESFKTNLAEFARKHRDRINDDPEFRQQFHQMCVSVGVDPLASGKGFWADLLGIGDFYYELGVKILQICLQTRSMNGGIISLKELLVRLQSFPGTQRGSPIAINKEDVYRALEKVEVLGNGLRVVVLPSKEKILISIPMEINMDHELLINVAFENNGCVSKDQFLRTQGWSLERLHRVVQPLLDESAIWIDRHDGKQRFFLFS
jgi:ESCRT-II complex subunit VPS22